MDIINYKQMLAGHVSHVKMINRLVENIVELDNETMNFLNGPQGMKEADNVKNHSIGVLEGISMTMSNQLVALGHTINKYPSTKPITNQMIDTYRKVPVLVNDINVPYESQQQKDSVEKALAENKSHLLSLVEELEEFINQEEVQ